MLLRLGLKGSRSRVTGMKVGWGQKWNGRGSEMEEGRLEVE